ncbi:MAG: signal peptidase I [Clostridia bacterium]|nr:signal peptidase I [Clostridia bacterium]
MKYTSNLKEFKEWTLTKRIAYNFVLAILCTLVLGVLAINIFNIRLDEVLSDSMAPVFTDQDIVLIKSQDSYEIHDIIEYRKDGINVTHRIVDYDPETGIYTTKGEHHGAADDATIKKEDINGKVIGIWNNGRAVYNGIKDNYFLILTIVIGCWAISSTIAGELEMKKHNILAVL